jgi:hypothetical protein
MAPKNTPELNTDSAFVPTEAGPFGPSVNGTLDCALAAWAGKASAAARPLPGTLTCGQVMRDVLNPLLVASGLVPWENQQQVRRYVDQKLLKGTKSPYTVQLADAETWAMNYTAKCLVEGPARRPERFIPGYRKN